MAIIAPVRAATLHTWNFDPGTRDLTVTLPSTVTPDYFLLAQPARIVLDLPNTTLGSVSSAQTYQGAIRSIRLSEVQGGSRIVIEFAPDTLLDPRHAELTSTDLGNGQTEWTLHPLLQDAVPSTVASTPPSAPSSPAAAPPRPAEPPAVSSPEPSTVTAEPPSVVTPPAAVASANTPDSEPESPSAIAPEDATADAPEPSPGDAPDPAFADSEMGEPIPVIPAPSEPEIIAETTDDLPALPEIANSATTGAAQALPSGVDPLAGVRTDAAALAGINNADVVDTPPEQLPLDPFAASSQARVAVPSLEAADSTPAPTVSVPAIGEVPDAPASPPPASQPAPVTATAPNQVLPPGSTAAPPAAAAAPPTVADAGPDADAIEPSAQAVAPNTVPSPTAAEAPSRDVVAANSIEIPTIPVPPDSWADTSTAGLTPNEVRPPAGEAIAQAPPPPAETPPPPSTANTVPPPVRASGAPTSPPPAPQTSPPPPPTQTAPAEPPPFLESSSGAPPTPEQPSIPPPPSRSPDDGTVPFGAPLPQTKALGDDFSRSASPAVVGIPVGTRLALQYPGTEPLVLADQAPTYEVLTVVGDVYADNGQRLLSSGTEVLGRFEGFDESGRRFVSQVIIQGGDRQPLLAESDWLIGSPQMDGGNAAIGATAGAAAVTLLTGLSGFGLVGGAAAGAAAASLESPQLVTIQPGDIIEVEVVDDILPFNDAPDITQQYR